MKPLEMIAYLWEKTRNGHVLTREEARQWRESHDALTHWVRKMRELKMLRTAAKCGGDVKWQEEIEQAIIKHQEKVGAE